MINADLTNLSRLGFLKINYSNIDPMYQYYVYKFIKLLEIKEKELQEETLDIFRKTLGEDTLKEISKYEKREENCISEEEYLKHIEKVSPLIEELNKQTFEVNVKKLPADVFFELMSTNLDLFEDVASDFITKNIPNISKEDYLKLLKLRKSVVYNGIIDLLKEILWEEPTNEINYEK